MSAIFERSRSFLELRYAGRRLRRAPSFAAAAVGTLAIGIGANSAMFGLVDALLLRPPAHVTHPGRVVRVRVTNEDPLGGRTVSPVSNYPSLYDVSSSGAFEFVAGYSVGTISVGRGPDAVAATAMVATPAFFRVFGTRPHLGAFRLADSADVRGDGGVVLSFGFWKRQFASNPRIIGAPVVLDNTTYTVVGIAPDGFTVVQPRRVDLWISIGSASRTRLVPPDWRNNRGSYWLEIVARLRAGVSPDMAARVTAAALADRRTGIRDADMPVGIVTASLAAGRAGEASRDVKVSLWLAGLTTFVLLIACANVANLVLTKHLARSREYAVLLALGATAWQVRRQVLADVALLSLAAVLLGTLVDFAARRIVPWFLSNEIPVPSAFLDTRAQLFAAASGSVALIILSVVSLVLVRPKGLLRASYYAAGAGPFENRRARYVLLAVQTALCVALLFWAGLFAKSLHRVESLDLGVQLERTIQANMNLTTAARPPNDTRRLYEAALESVRDLPGVERAALAERDPYTFGRAVGPWTAAHTREELWTNRPVPFITGVGAGFFATVGASSLRGRDFADADRAGAPPVAILNAPLAKYLWPDQDPLGQCIWFDNAPTCARVVGVLGGVWKFKVLDRDRMVLYVPLAQSPGIRPGSLMIRARGRVRTLVPQVRAVLQTIEPDLPAASVILARDIAAHDFRPWRLGAAMFSLFGSVATLIAAIGLYGAVSYTTALRAREIGVRLALGARWHHIVRTVGSPALAAVLIGLLAGSVVGLTASRLMAGILFQTSPRDVTVLAQTALLLCAVAVIAAIAPVASALRTNPAISLRSEA